MTKEKEILEQDEKKKKWSFLGWGLLFLLIWTIALMFILEVALHPADSIIATIVAYALGLLGLGVFAGLTRSKWKVLVTFPLAILIIFGAGYLLHLVNAPIYNPLAPVSERVFVIVDELDSIANTSIADNIPADLLNNMESIKQYAGFAFVVDLIISLPIFILGTLSVTWIVQIFTQKPKWWVIFSAFFALIFFMIGMIMTPFVHLVIASVVDLGTNMSIGALYMVNGLSYLQDLQNADQADINEAVANLNLASEWFQKGGEDIKVFLGALSMSPYLGDAADDFNHLFQAAFILLGGAGTFVNGSYQLFKGFDLISKALNTSSGSLTMQDDQVKQAIDDDLFNQGIDFINEGLELFDNSSYVFDDALSEIKQVDWQEIKTELHELPIEGTEEIDSTLDQMEGYLSIFENATGLIDVLISKPTFANGSQSNYATLIHFFLGAYNIMKAQEIIGDETNFAGTEVYFNRAGEHFNVTYNALQTRTVAQLIHSDTPILNGTVAFIVDMTGLAADLSFFGGDMGPTLVGLNSTLSVLSNGYENVTDYDSIRADISDSITELDNLKDTAHSIDNRILGIQENATANIYGEFSETASDFASNFQKFNITLNLENAYYIAQSFYYLFGAMKDLKDIKGYIETGQTAFDNSDYLTAYNNFLAANTSLDSCIDQMWNASYYFNQTIGNGMGQLSSSGDAIALIYFSLVSIQTDINVITEIAGGGSPTESEITEVNNRLDHINTVLVNVNNELAQVKGQ
ncbi:MAG: hypothetical protein ACTSRR_01475 [Candidatus Heimdallarchaeaceae archaeon]